MIESQSYSFVLLFSSSSELFPILRTLCYFQNFDLNVSFGVMLQEHVHLGETK